MPRRRCCWCANRRGAEPEGQRLGVDRRQAAPLATPQPRSWQANPAGQQEPPGALSPRRTAATKLGGAKPPARSGQSTNRTAWRTSALAAVGLDVKNDQKDRWNQHEHQAGHEAEIVGFHYRSLELRDRITAAGPEPASFIARCGWSPPAKPGETKPDRARPRFAPDLPSREGQARTSPGALIKPGPGDRLRHRQPPLHLGLAPAPARP